MIRYIYNNTLKKKNHSNPIEKIMAVGSRITFIMEGGAN